MAEIALDANDEQQALVCLERLSLLTPKWEVCAQVLDSLKNKPNCTTSSIDWPALPPLKDKPSITACLIVKNEERFLDKCLQSLQGTADQIVVVDTGSTDRTVEIARTHDAEIHHFEWCDDFAAARNFSLEKARGDWVLILDADEVLTPEGRKELQIDTAAQNVIGYRIHCTHLEPAAEGGYQPMVMPGTMCLALFEMPLAFILQESSMNNYFLRPPYVQMIGKWKPVSGKPALTITVTRKK